MYALIFFVTDARCASESRSPSKSAARNSPAANFRTSVSQGSSSAGGLGIALWYHAVAA